MSLFPIEQGEFTKRCAISRQSSTVIATEAGQALVIFCKEVRPSVYLFHLVLEISYILFIDKLH